MSNFELLTLISTFLMLVCLLFFGARVWKRGRDRNVNIMNLRNCQQAMRGHQGMNNLMEGKPFTKADLTSYFSFPRDVNHEVRYTPGDTVTPMGVLWLKVTPPGDIGGEYGPSSHEIHGW